MQNEVLLGVLSEDNSIRTINVRAINVFESQKTNDISFPTNGIFTLILPFSVFVRFRSIETIRGFVHHNKYVEELLWNIVEREKIWFISIQTYHPPPGKLRFMQIWPESQLFIWLKLQTLCEGHIEWTKPSTLTSIAISFDIVRKKYKIFITSLRTKFIDKPKPSLRDFQKSYLRTFKFNTRQ